MMITSEQIRAARAMVRMDQEDLARQAGISVVTIRRIEAAEGFSRVAAGTLEGVQMVLETAGVEFIEGGVRRVRAPLVNATLLDELQAISRESAAYLAGREMMTDADLYDDDGLPA